MVLMQVSVKSETRDVVSFMSSRQAPTGDGYADWNVSEDEAVWLLSYAPDYFGPKHAVPHIMLLLTPQDVECAILSYWSCSTFSANSIPVSRFDICPF